jgi:hypothetical protein
MFQNKTSKTMIIGLTLIALFNFSCAKKPSGIRTIRQTEAQAINPSSNTYNKEAAAAQGTLYEIYSIERPDTSASDGTVVVKSEIKTPEGKFIPVTATHDGKEDENGLINLEGNHQLLVQSRCINENCATYVMLITLLINNYAYHQNLAVSYSKDETYFHVDNKNAARTSNFYRSLNEAVQANNIK